MEAPTLIAISEVVAVAGITSSVGLLGIAGTIVVARSQARSAMQTAAQVRFAAWQITKREVFAEFIDAARSMRDQLGMASRSPDVSATYAKQGHRALFYAYKDAREKVDDLLENPKDLADETTWNELLEKLREDVLKEGPAT